MACLANLTQTSGLSEATYAIDAEATRLCTGLSDDQLCWRQRPRRWSITENLAHLRITAEVFLPAVDTVLATTRLLRLQSDGPFSLSLYGRLLKWRIESRPIIRMRAPALLWPQLLWFSARGAGAFPDFAGSLAAKNSGRGWPGLSRPLDFPLQYPATSVSTCLNSS